MNRITRSYSVDKDVAEHSKTNSQIVSMSDWINDRYRAEFMNLEAKTTELQACMRRAEDLKQQILELKAMDKAALQITKEEHSWLKNEALKRLERGATFEGVYKYYINEIARKPLTRRQLRILIDQIRAEAGMKE